MKNRKSLVFTGVALLALVVVGLSSLRERVTPVDAASSPRQNGNRILSTGRGEDAASTGAALASAGATVRTNTVAATVPTVQTPTKRGTLPFVLTSKTAFTKPLRLAAEAQGAKTVSTVSRKSILVEATPDVRARLEADSRFEDVTEFAPAEKIQPALAALVEKGEKTVEVSIVSLDAIDRETVIAALTAAGGEMLKGCINEGNTVRAKIPSDAVATLAGCGEVRWMETFVRPRILNDLAVKADCMNVVEVWNTHGLTGEGQKISTSDTGIDSGNPATLHEDLRNRVREMKVVDGCNASDVNGHGTHTAGSIVGDGTKSGGQIRGAAYGADLYAWFCGTTGGSIDTPETLDLLFRNGGAWMSYVHSASWGSGYNQYYPSYSQCGQYNSMSEENDRYVWNHPDFLPVYSAGNDRDYWGKGAIATPASAKNVLAVGATQSSRIGYDGGWGNGNPKVTADFSSGGPCLDGRIKPDIAAPGVGILSTRSHGVEYSYGIKDDFYAYDSGTSMACPLTAGAVALVRQWLVEQKGFEDEDGRRPTAALMKAVIMGGAKDASVPNNDQGWGRVDLENTLFPSGGRAVKLIDRIPFEQGFVTNIVIETTNAAPLDVQLVWVDYPGSSSGSQSTPRLVNDLDLTVESYGSKAEVFCYGNGGDEPDTLNNVESVRIGAAPKSKYVITVDCKEILHDYTEGGAAALYIRGAFDPEATPTASGCVKLVNADREFFALDKALAAVTEDGEEVRILRPTRLFSSVTVPTNCTVAVQAAEPGVTPVVRCSGRAVVTVPGGVAVTVDGVAFTNALAGLVVSDGGELRVTGGSSFGTLESVIVEEGGSASFSDVTVGDLAGLYVAEGSTNEFANVSILGAAAEDWMVCGRLTLDAAQLGSNQTVTVAASGNLTLKSGVSHLTGITFEFATADSLLLAGTLTETVSVTAPDAWQKNTVFGRYAGMDEATARASAKFLVDALDEEGDLGGNAEAEGTANGTLYWGHINWTRAQGVCSTTIGGVTLYYRKLNTLLKNVCDGSVDPSVPVDVAVYRDATCPAVTADTLCISDTHTLSGALRLSSEVSGDPSEAKGVVTVTFGADGGFVIPKGSSLEITNVVASGAGAKLADCAFKVRGGALALENGAVLSSLCDAYDFYKVYGGAIAVTSGTVTMKPGSRIENCVAHAGANGGAIWLGGSAASANLLGGTIAGCSAAYGGAVYAWSGSSGGATVSLAGDFTATDNAMSAVSDAASGNIYLMRLANFALTDELTGEVGVSFGTKSGYADLNATNAAFLAVAGGVTPAAAASSASNVVHDVDATLVGAVNGAGTAIVWTVRPDNGGQCDPGAARYIVGIGGAYRYYEAIADAFGHIDADATVYVTEGDMLGRDIEVRHAVRLVSSNGWQRIHRVDDATVRIVEGGSLTLEDVGFSGMSVDDLYPYHYENNSSNGLFSVDGGSLTLGSGAVVGPVDGSDSRAANAITVFNGGSLTMLSGSTVENSINTHLDVSDATGCGGGVLLDNATAYFKGGTIRNCRAHRAGAVYVANGSTAYVSGDFSAADSSDLAGQTNNVVVSQNSNLVLDGELTGRVGVNEGIASDTNSFACVEWNWPSIVALTNSAAHFVHDRRGVSGVAVTNGLGGAALVWDDTLTHAGKFRIDGRDYQIFLAPGQTVAVPKDFSVSPKSRADGRIVLSLEGGVEGCWYTVYSTEDLAKPFAAEASVQLKKDETFEYEIDRTKQAKYYKVVAEEGLK